MRVSPVTFQDCFGSPSRGAIATSSHTVQVTRRGWRVDRSHWRHARTRLQVSVAWYSLIGQEKSGSKSPPKTHSKNHGNNSPRWNVIPAFTVWRLTLWLLLIYTSSTYFDTLLWHVSCADLTLFFQGSYWAISCQIWRPWYLGACYKMKSTWYCTN